MIHPVNLICLRNKELMIPPSDRFPSARTPIGFADPGDEKNLYLPCIRRRTRMKTCMPKKRRVTEYRGRDLNGLQSPIPLILISSGIRRANPGTKNIRKGIERFRKGDPKRGTGSDHPSPVSVRYGYPYKPNLLNIFSVMKRRGDR